MRSAAAWALALPAAAWVVMRLGGLERGFPLVPLAAYTPYAAVGALLAGIAALLLRRRGPAAVALVSAALLAAVVVPRAIGEGSARSGTPLRVLSANVLGGTVSAPRLIGLARRERADVLAVQELTPELDAELRGAFAHRVAEPRATYRGTGIYSRLPLEPAPAPRGTTFAMTAAVARLPEGKRSRVLSVHPVAPLGGATMPLWRRDLRALPPASRPGPPLILAGDFNATIDHAELRRLLDTGYRDAAAEVGAGLRGTWPNGTRRTPPVAIDHVLVPELAAVRSFSIHELPGSDHDAVLAEVVLP